MPFQQKSQGVLSGNHLSCQRLQMFKALCHLRKAIKRLTNDHKQTAEGENAKTCSLCFSQFPFNLTHAFVLSLKAPFPLMASLVFFTLQWQHRISSQQLDAVTKCSPERIYKLCSNIRKEAKLSAFSSERRRLLRRQMIYAKAFLFLFQRQNQSP